jgi:hypothetical protein
LLSFSLEVFFLGLKKKKKKKKKKKNNKQQQQQQQQRQLLSLGAYHKCIANPIEVFLL